MLLALLFDQLLCHDVARRKQDLMRVSPVLSALCFLCALAALRVSFAAQT